MAEKIFDTDLRINGPGGPLIISGAGAPEGVVTAPVGSQFHRTDGGAGTTLYIKESGTGNTGWVAVSSGGGSIPTGTGSPEGIVTASVGGLYVQTDADPGSVLWVKESGTGNTGWNRPVTIDVNGFPTAFLTLPLLNIIAGAPADYPPAFFIFADATPLIFIGPTEITYAYWYANDGFGAPYYDIIATEPRGGGSGATGGSAVLDFGAAPGSSVAEVTVTGQTGILVGSRVRVWIQGSTADHNEYEHSRIFPALIGVGVADIVAGVGFTICAVTEMRLTGTVAVKWEWQ